MAWHTVDPSIAQKIRRNGAKFGFKSANFKYHPFTAENEVAYVYFTGFSSEDPFRCDIHLGSRIVIHSADDGKAVSEGIEKALAFRDWLETYHNTVVNDRKEA